MSRIRSLGWWKVAASGLVAAGIVGGAVAYHARHVAAEETAGMFGGSAVDGSVVAELAPYPEPADEPTEKPDGDLAITYHRPLEEAPYHVQVQVGFDQPLVPLTNVTDPQRQEALSHFSISPKPEGTFRLVGIQAVVFSPKSPFPAATEYTVSIKSGLEDVHGRRLAKDFSWTFHTRPLRVTFGSRQKRGLPLDPEFRLSSNGALEVDSLTERLKLVEVDGGQTRDPQVAWVVTPDENNPPDVQQVNEYRRRYTYHLKPRRSLHKNTSYQLTVEPGVKPKQGNVPTKGSTVLKFSTYGPLQFEFHASECGERFQSSYWVTSSNPLEPETIKGALSISPPIKGESAWASPYSTSLYLPEEQLQPDAEYTLRISREVRDAFGQRLPKPWVHKFRTAHLRPRIDVLGDLRLITPRTQPVLPYRAVNPRVLRTRVLPVTERQFLDWAFAPKTDSVRDLLDGHDSLARKSSDPYKEDAEELRGLQFGTLLGRAGRGLFLYGFTTTEKDRCEDPPKPARREGALLRTDLAVHARLLPSEMHVWVTHLVDGSPAAGCEVSVFRYARERGSFYKDRKNRTEPRQVVYPKPKELFSGTTDQEGRLRIPGTKLQDPADAGGRYLRGGEGLVVVARESDDFAYATDRYWLGTEQRGGYYWDGPQLHSLGGIFSDRQLYQPHEEVKLKGVVRYRTEDRMEVPRGLKFKVALDDPRGESRDLGEVKTDEFGAFSLSVAPKPSESLGYYRVSARSESPRLWISGSFRRADFRPPRYKARLTTDKALYLVGERIKLQAQGDYLFGAPLAGGRGTFRVNLEPQEFSPPGWDEFQFAVPSWIDHYLGGRESPEKSLVERTEELNDRGRADLEVPVLKDDVPEPMSYQLQVDVKDVSGQSVGASRSVTVLPYPQLTGVRVGRSFVQSEQPCKAEIIVTDPRGRPQAGVKLAVELATLDWVLKVVGQGDYKDEEWVLESKVVASEKATSAAKPVKVSLTPPKAGEYLIVARFAGRKPTGTEGAAWIYASGSGAVSYRRDDREPHDLDLPTDREEYEVGDVVQVAVASPFKRARALFCVEREKVFEQQFEEIAQGERTFRFRLTTEMIPNVFVQVVLTELGPADGNLYGDVKHVPYRFGSTKVEVDRAPHRLGVKVSPRDPKLRPGGAAVLNCHVDDATGKPAAVQLTVMVVDEAILQLTGYRPPDLVEQIFLERGLSLALWDNRPLVVHAKDKLPPPPKGWGWGNGGEGGGIAAARLRKDFVHLAYFNPDLRTDGNGNARCEFTVPDNLTTWRAMVVAVSRDFDFGSGDATFIVNQPLMLNGLLPRFARVDDEITTGVAVNNQTGGKGEAEVTCQVVKGDELLEPRGAPQSADTITIDQNRTGAVRFPKRAVGVGDTALRFECKLTGEDEEGEPVEAADRLELPLVIQEPGYWETVAVRGEVGGQIELPVKLTDAIRTDLGQVRVSLSSTVYGNLAPDAEWLIEYPYRCAEQLSSRVLGLLAMKEPLRKFGMSIRSDRPLDQLIREDLADLLECQRSNGGFGYWPEGQYSAPFLSTQVATVLAEARRHGHDVPKSATQRLADYLQRDPPEYRSWWDEPRRLHYRVLQAAALKALDEEFTQHYGELATNTSLLPLLDWIRLSGLFHQTGNWKEQSAELYGEIKKREWITARGVHLEEWKGERDWWSYMDTATALTAAGLKLDLQLAPEHERVAKTANYLVGSRKHKRRRTTYDTAQVLDALSRYVEVREATKPDFTASVGLGEGRPTDYRFRGYQLGLQEHVVPLADLKPGMNRLRIEKTGRGTLYSTVELQYMPKGEQPPQSQGFFIAREMTNVRTDRPIRTADDSLQVGDVVRVKLTLNAPQAAHNVVVEAPVPAGLEPVNTSFQTTPSWMREQRSSSRRDWWRPNPFDHTEFHRDRIALFSQYFPAGVYEYEYLLQATSPGLYTYPASRIYRMYEPEEFGSTKSGRVRVSG